MIRPQLIRSLFHHLFVGRNPVYVHYFITHRCPFRCRQCNVPNQKSHREMTLGEITEVARTLKALNAGLINIGGGEPMLRPDLAGIIRIFHQQGFSVRLQTTGTLADMQNVRALKAAGLHGVSVSLDSLKSDVEAYIYQHQGILDKILCGIDCFSEVFRRRGSLCMLNTVISSQNLEEIPQIVEFAKKIGWQISLAPVHLVDDPMNNPFRNSADDMRFTKADFKAVERLFDHLLQMKRNGYPISNSSSYLQSAKHFILTGKSDWRCSAGRSYFLIRPDGRFSPCTDLYSGENVLSPGFAERFRSDDFQRKMTAKINYCSGCVYPCWAEMERFFWPEVVTERIWGMIWNRRS